MGGSDASSPRRLLSFPLPVMIHLDSQGTFFSSSVEPYLELECTLNAAAAYLQDIPTADEDDASSEDSDREPLLHEGESEDEIARDDDDSSEVPSLEDNATDDSDDSSEPLSLVRLELEDEYGDNYDDLSGFPCLVELENEEENSEDYEDLSEVHPLREAEAEDEESVEWGEIEVRLGFEFWILGPGGMRRERALVV